MAEAINNEVSADGPEQNGVIGEVSARVAHSRCSAKVLKCIRTACLYSDQLRRYHQQRCIPKYRRDRIRRWRLGCSLKPVASGAVRISVAIGYGPQPGQWLRRDRGRQDDDQVRR